jgi:glycosyltransferase involved in cell wall biosynthesis
MSCGAPVLGAAGGAVLEVAGAAGSGFDPYSVESIADAIARLVIDRQLAAELRARAIPETARNTWDQAANMTRATLEAVAGVA